MKIINIISFTIILLINTYSLAQENDHDEKHQVQMLTGSIDSNGALMTVAVEGMVCDFCAQAIEKVFMKRDEVLGINVNLENQKVIIYLQKESNIEDETLLAIFEDAGYTVDKINRTI